MSMIKTLKKTQRSRLFFIPLKALAGAGIKSIHVLLFLGFWGMFPCLYAQDVGLGSIQFQRFHNPWIYNLDHASQGVLQKEGSQSGYLMLQEGKWYLDFAVNATKSLSENTYSTLSLGPSRNQYYKLFCIRKTLAQLNECPQKIPQTREDLKHWQVGDWGYYQGYLGFAILAGWGIASPPVNLLPKWNVEGGWQFYIERKSEDEFYLELRPTKVRTISVITGITPVAGLESYFYQEWAQGKAFLLSLSRHKELIDQVLARDVSVLEARETAGRVDWYKSHRGFKFYLQTPIFQFFSLQSYQQKTEEVKKWQYIWEERDNHAHRYAYESFSGWRWFNEATAEMNHVEWNLASANEIQAIWRFQKTNADHQHLLSWLNRLPDWQKEFLPKIAIKSLPKGTMQLSVAITLPLRYFVPTSSRAGNAVLGKKAVKEAQARLHAWQESVRSWQNGENNFTVYGNKEWWQWEAELKDWILSSSRAHLSIKGQYIKQRVWNMKTKAWISKPYKD